MICFENKVSSKKIAGLCLLNVNKAADDYIRGTAARISQPLPRNQVLATIDAFLVHISTPYL